MGKLFFGGTPTDIDVRAIEAAISDVGQGDIITHTTIEAATGLSRTSSRYHSVVSAWRRKLRADRVVLKALPGVGYKVLSDMEIVEAGIDKFTSGARAQKRGIDIASVSRRENLDEVQSRKLDHFQRLAAITLNAASETVREIRALPIPQAVARPKNI